MRDAFAVSFIKCVGNLDGVPGNIMLTKSGSKLLDFGLAKLTQQASPAASPLSQLPTAAQAITAQGMILGTLQYIGSGTTRGQGSGTPAQICLLSA